MRKTDQGFVGNFARREEWGLSCKMFGSVSRRRQSDVIDEITARLDILEASRPTARPQNLTDAVEAVSAGGPAGNVPAAATVEEGEPSNVPAAAAAAEEEGEPSRSWLHIRRLPKQAAAADQLETALTQVAPVAEVIFMKGRGQALVRMESDAGARCVLVD